MLVVLGPAFFCCKYSFLHDMCGRVVFFPKALCDPEIWLVIVSMGARLFIALGVGSVSLRFSVVISSVAAGSALSHQAIRTELPKAKPEPSHWAHGSLLARLYWVAARFRLGAVLSRPD